MNRSDRLRFVAALGICLLPATARAASPPPSPPPTGAPAGYDAFVRDAKVTPGLIAVVRKAGKVYLVLQKSQLGQDFVETSVPATGLGGFGPAPGEPYVAPARIMRFERNDDAIVIRWPNTFARVDAGTPQMIGAQLSLPGSVVAVTPIVAESPTAGSFRPHRFSATSRTSPRSLPRSPRIRPTATDSTRRARSSWTPKPSPRTRSCGSARLGPAILPIRSTMHPTPAASKSK